MFGDYANPRNAKRHGTNVNGSVQYYMQGKMNIYAHGDTMLAAFNY